MAAKMFWALAVEPQKKYEQDVKDAFHISNASLCIPSAVGKLADLDGIVTSLYVEDGSGDEYLLCNLSYRSNLNQTLDLNFVDNERVAFRLEQHGPAEPSLSVHLTGYLLGSPEDSDDEDDVDFDPAMISGMSDASIDSSCCKIEEYDSDESDEEEAPKLAESKATKKRKAETDLRETVNSIKGKKNKLSISKQGDDESDDDMDDEEDDLSDEDLDDEDMDDEDDGMDEDDEENENQSPVQTKKAGQVQNNKAKDRKPMQVQNGNAQQKIAQKKGEAVNGKLDLTKKQTPTKTATKPATESKPSTPADKKAPTPNKNKTPKRVIKGGIIVEDTTVGTGAELARGKQVAVYYEGRLKTNDKVFDSQLSGKPLKFKLGQGEVIKGWDLGVHGMKVGGKRRLTIPPKMAYGEAGAGSDIPPNATLVFDIEAKAVN